MMALTQADIARAIRAAKEAGASAITVDARGCYSNCADGKRRANQSHKWL